MNNSLLVRILSAISRWLWAVLLFFCLMTACLITQAAWSTITQGLAPLWATVPGLIP